ncbi:MAG: hypothetical protein IJ574_05525 [Bacilli bacterium]|nr:hypothetical protein [Bacilli bacterium]
MNKTKDLKDDYYNEIKEKLIEDIAYSAVKDMSKERHRVATYYDVGKILAEAGKHYGDGIIKEYSNKLKNELGKKYNERTLRSMRQLYLFFGKQKWSPVGTKLSISHIRLLFCFDDNNKVNYYAEQVEKRSLSKRQLEELIKSKEYERLDEEAKL